MADWGWLIGIAAAPALVWGAALMLRRRAAADDCGRRLLAHARERSDYTLLVGVPAHLPTRWSQVSEIDTETVRLKDAPELALDEVTAYLVAYPSRHLADCRKPDGLPLPDWVRFPEEAAVASPARLDASDLAEGRRLVPVEFGASTGFPHSDEHYSTTLTNRSGKRVRVLSFGGYIKDGDAYRLSTITGALFARLDFIDWYGLAEEWLAPGRSATDHNNYGSPDALWAYFCEDEDGRRSTTGGCRDGVFR